MKSLIKPSIVLGAILGAAFGLISLIPLAQCITCFAIAFVGGAVVYYLKKNAFVGILSPQDGAFIGAISGFMAFVSASVIYLPVNLIFGLLFNPNAKFGTNLTSSLIVASYNLFVIPLLVVFIALLSALFNAFSGLVVAYILEKIENNPISEQAEIIIDQ